MLQPAPLHYLLKVVHHYVERRDSAALAAITMELIARRKIQN